MDIEIEDVPRARIISYFKSAIDFICGAIGKGGGVLVHCKAGKM